MRVRTSLVILLVTIGSTVMLTLGAAHAGGPEPGTYWELVNGEYVKKYKPLTFDDTGGPANWQTRQAQSGIASQYDLQFMSVGRVMVDPEVIARIPLTGLSTLPANPSVLGPSGVTLDPAQYREVLQVDLVLGGPLAELPPGQPIGLAVLRGVTGQPTYNGPGTPFHGMSVAERYDSTTGLGRVGVDGTNRFVAAPSNTILFLMGDRARFWIPMGVAQGTAAIQGHVFQPGTPIADTSRGEPGSAEVLTPIDLAELPTTRLATARDTSQGQRRSAEPETVASSGGTSNTLWLVLLVVGIVLVGLAAAMRLGPAFATGTSSRRPKKAKKAAKKRAGRKKAGGMVQIDPPPAEPPVVTGEPSVLRYAADLVVIGDLVTAAGEPTPPEVRVPTEPKPVELPTVEEPREVPELGGGLPDVVPGPPTTLVPGDVGLAPVPVRPCEPERIAWTAAQQACDQARFEAAAAEADAADARAELDRLRAEYPPLDWKSEGTLDADMDTGEHVTDLDLRLGDFAERRAKLPSLPPGAERAERSRQTREDARKEYEDYQAKAAPLRERVRRADEARARADEACAKADSAHAAYERCMGAWSERAPAPTPAPAPKGRSPQPVAPTPTPASPPPTPKASSATTSAGGTTTRSYEPPTVTSPGPTVRIPTPPTPPGGCTQDLVRDVCPPETFEVGRMLVLELKGSGRYDNSWDRAAREFAAWVARLGYSTASGGAFTAGSTQLEIAGDDVGPLLSAPMWKGLNAIIEITAQVRFERITLACQRTWPCVDGKYGAPVTTTKLVRNQRYSARPEKLGDIATTVRVDADMMTRFLRAVWGPYGAGQRASEEFVRRCH
jgi:hypothetical protein